MNALKNHQKHALNMYLEKHREDYAPLTRDDIARRATDDLGFTVTGGNVTGSMKAIGMVSTHPGAVGQRRSMELVERVEALEAIVDALQDEINRMRSGSAVAMFGSRVTG